MAVAVTNTTAGLSGKTLAVLETAQTWTALQTFSSGIAGTTLAFTGNATVGGTLGVTGAVTLSSTLAVTGATTAAAITATSIKTAAGVTSTLASGVWETIHIPGATGLYLYLGHYGSSGYSQYAIVSYNASGSPVAVLATNTSKTEIEFQSTGAAIQMRQNSGSAIVVSWSVTQLAGS